MSDDQNTLLDQKSRAQIDVDALITHALETNDDYPYQQRGAALRRAEELLRGRGEIARADEVARDALIFTFRLTTQSGAESRKTTHQPRFAPSLEFKDAQGNLVAIPDPAAVDTALVQHAKSRAGSIANPVTNAIYCDFVCEFGEKRERREHALRAAAQYLLAAEAPVTDDDGVQFFAIQGYILRALELAQIFRDRDGIQRATDVALRTMEAYAQPSALPIRIDLLDTLLRRVKPHDSAVIGRMTALVDNTASSFFSAGKEFAGRRATELKLLLPAVKQDPELQKRVRRELVDSLLREGDAQGGGGIGASYLYSQALQASGGVLSASEQAALRRRIQEANRTSETHMKEYRYEFTVSDEEVQRFITQILTDDLESSLRRMALLIPRVADAEQLAAKLMKDYPLSHLFPVQYLQDGRVITTTSGGVDLTEDHTLLQYERYIQAHSIELGFVFDELIRRGLDATTLSSYLSNRDFFTAQVMPAVSEALAHLFEGRYYSAVVVLLPQIERMLRDTNDRLGLPTLRAIEGGEQRVIYLREALDALRPVFDMHLPDAYTYFSMILVDKRGLGLRDTAAHGLLEYNAAANKLQAHLLLHLLLILALFEQQPVHTEPGVDPDEPPSANEV